jgi:hypothetical protein
MIAVVAHNSLPKRPDITTPVLVFTSLFGRVRSLERDDRVRDDGRKAEVAK